MRVLRIVLRAWLLLPYGFRKLTATGAFGKKGGVYVDGPGSCHGHALKAALWQHHVKQYHGASCSVASVATVVNALLATQRPGHRPVSQQELLGKVRTGNWKERMSSRGDRGRRGLPLPLLGEVVESSLRAFDVRYREVETVCVSRKAASSRRVRNTLLGHLTGFERSGRTLIIAHFDQGAFVRTLSIPHISPVGGFDPGTRHVTLLDVDPGERPYRVPFDTFLKGLSSDYHNVFRPLGYGSGGYVRITLY